MWTWGCSIILSDKSQPQSSMLRPARKKGIADDIAVLIDIESSFTAHIRRNPDNYILYS